MNAQRWCWCGSAIAVIAIVGQVAAADDGRPSQLTLADMGFGGLVVMSDDEALSIRGQGYNGSGSSVHIFGNSFATIKTPIGGAHSENGYVANGKHFAAGGNHSEAGVKISISKSKGHNGGMNGHDWKPGVWRPIGGMPNGGHPGGVHGGHSKSITIKFFAGGHSWAKAF